jgi:hypothetical protein
MPTNFPTKGLRFEFLLIYVLGRYRGQRKVVIIGTTYTGTGRSSFVITNLFWFLISILVVTDD